LHAILVANNGRALGWRLHDGLYSLYARARVKAVKRALNDGPKNIVDSVDYIASRVWADERGRNQAGAVLIQEQRILAARAIQKADARPGGYVATGGHGGILGAAGHDGPPLLHYSPTARHTWRSEVNITKLPFEVSGIRQEGSRIETVPVAIKDPDGKLLDRAIPKVAITKDASYRDDAPPEPEAEVDLLAMISHMLKTAPLAGFVVEGFTPYGRSASNARARLLLYLNFGSMTDTILAASAIPTALIGGIFALVLMGIPFSVSATIGFVALFGISAMNGNIVIAYFNILIDAGFERSAALTRACAVKMRPMAMTCIVACVGLLPAAVSTGIGSQVQKPLAVIVVSGSEQDKNGARKRAARADRPLFAPKGTGRGPAAATRPGRVGCSAL
jgi:hypothetical protein